MLAALALAMALPPVPAAYAAPGDLDGNFGTNGQVLQGGEAFQYRYGDAVAVQKDGKLVVAGSGYNFSSQEFLVARYNSNGSIDSGFGSGGIVLTDFIDGETYNTASAVAIQPDGKIIAAGSSGTDFALARFTSDGTLDDAFGDGGKVTTNYSVSGAGDSAKAVAVQPDGKIVVAGSSYDAVEYYEFALLRYNSDGSLDSTFGDGGIVITSIGDITEDLANAVAIQTDGKIIVAGESFHDFAVARYNSDGSLDNSFGEGGIVTTDFGGENASGYAVAIQADGKIVVAGAGDVYDPSTMNCISSGGYHCQYWDFALARYNSDGSLDESFGNAGKATTDLNRRGNDDFGRGVAIQTNGKIVVAGYSETSEHEFSNEDENYSTNNQFSLARYNANGSLDNSFSTDGIVITDIDGSGSFETGSAIAIQTDGKIVVAGTDGDRNAIALIRYEGDTDAGGGSENEDLQAFVTRFYRLVLGRDPDTDGLNGWVGGLSTGAVTGCDIASGFVFSPEFINRNTSDEDYVDILYQAFFNREADTAGRIGWLNELKSGRPRRDVLDGFLSSQEFATLAESFGIITCAGAEDPLTDFVTRFYRLVLGRDPDSVGLNGWVGGLSAGAVTGCDIATGFVFSPEFMNRNTSDEEYVDILYRAFFNREADTGGRSGWLNELKSGRPRREVLDGFLSSQEFATLAESFGIITCRGGSV